MGDIPLKDYVGKVQAKFHVESLNPEPSAKWHSFSFAEYIEFRQSMRFPIKRYYGPTCRV